MKQYSLKELKELVETFYKRSADNSALHFIVWLRGDEFLETKEGKEYLLKVINYKKDDK